MKTFMMTAGVPLIALVLIAIIGVCTCDYDHLEPEQAAYLDAKDFHVVPEKGASITYAEPLFPVTIGSTTWYMKNRYALQIRHRIMKSQSVTYIDALCCGLAIEIPWLIILLVAAYVPGGDKCALVTLLVLWMLLMHLFLRSNMPVLPLLWLLVGLYFMRDVIEYEKAACPIVS